MSDTEFGMNGTDIRNGVAVGIVADNEDPEGLGRVKLTFPWRESDDESHWARVATPMAGDEVGTYFLPNVDDEVLVAFDSGNLNHPYVLGSLWNGDQPPPEDNADGENTVKTIKSDSEHTITLDDDDSAGKVEITTSGGHTITLDDSSGAETITIEDSSGQNTIEFDATKGSIAIESGTKLSVDAPNLEFTADGNISIDASGILTLNGTLVRIN